MLKNILFLIVLTSIISCQSDHKADLTEFAAQQPLVIDQVANTPTVIQPVEVEQDRNGNLWVVELTGYMRDIEASGEDIADGRIVVLQDLNSDGHYESRKIVLNNLLNPRAICLGYGGLMFTDGIQLKFTKLNGIDIGPIETVDSAYVIGGNIEHQPNGLLYGLDNWIYSANTTAKYKRQNGNWVKKSTLFRGQWGISQTKTGRLIYNNNSLPIAGEAYLPNSISNPYYNFEHLGVQPLTDNRFVYPTKATSVNRGYQDGVLDSLGRLTTYTSACSPFIFESNSLGEDYTSNVFVCAPEVNMITRYLPSMSDHRYQHQKSKAVLLESDLEIFRPVSMTLGLDGKLYIVDMRKGIIQHRAYMTDYLRNLILDKDLHKIGNQGMILTLTHRDSTYQMPKIDTNVNRLIALLESPNLSVRIQAQKLLMELPSSADMEIQLLATMEDDQLKHTQLHAYFLLKDHINISSKDLMAKFDHLNNVDVIKRVLQSNASANNPQFKKLYSKLLSDRTRSSQLAASVIASQFTELQKEWHDLAMQYMNDPIFCEALISKMESGYSDYLSLIQQEEQTTLLTDMLNACIVNKTQSKDFLPKLRTVPFDDDRTNGLHMFKSYCAACHGIDGLGQKLMAPSLAESIILKGHERGVAEIILNGSSKSEEFSAAMPSYKTDPNLTDSDIIDIIHYLKSTWAINSESIDLDDIKELRLQE